MVCKQLQMTGINVHLVHFHISNFSLKLSNDSKACFAMDFNVQRYDLYLIHFVIPEISLQISKQC